ncbi:HAMP domain-containing protein [bacterium D16-51]|nr:HAMP domain-containing protein [bacterium D16-59]RKI58415.1 HAMP domain-containing protein [bacterium D16-51]
MKKKKERQKKPGKFISIKTKLLGIILPVVIIIVTVLTGLSYVVSKSVIKENAQELLETSVKGQGSDIEAWLNQNLKSFQAAKQTLEQMNFNERQLQTFLNAYHGFDSNYPNGMYIADSDGTLYCAEAAQEAVLRGPDDNGNYINNGGFSDDRDLADDTDWQLFTAEGGKASAKIKNNEVSIATEQEGTVDYSVQFVQAGLPMKKGSTYKVSFDAYALADRTMKIGISAPDRDYKRYLEDTVVELTSEKQTFQYEFTMEDENDVNGRMEFNLGACGSTDTVMISNVFIQMTAGEEAGEESSKSSPDKVIKSEWFQSGLSRVNMGFTNAYTNEEGEQVISACGMLRTASGKVHVLSADMSLDKVSVYVNSFVKMEDAEAFLVNIEDNTILASRDTSLISKSLDETGNDYMKAVGKRILKNELSIAEINGNMTGFEKIEGTDWMLVSYVPSKTVFHDLNNIRNIMLLFGLVSVLVLTGLLERIIHIVISPIKKLTDVIKSMTDGDFTVHTQTKSNDEIGVMSRCVEKFIAAMRDMIASINNVSGILHNQADSSKDVSVQMLSASITQNQSMKELNETVEQLSISVSGIAESATTLAILVTETRDDGEGVSSKMNETVEISQKGKVAMQDVSVAMQNINNSVRKLQLAIDAVEKASEEITNITGVIGSIADETSLLSLNASIEAARAGEAGRGFTVVATEIGKLAQTSMESVQHIDDLVLEIKSSIGDVINQANDSVDNINNSNILIENAVETFDIIFENIDTVGNLIHQMITKVDKVEDEARNVAAISEEQAASAEEIASSSDVLVDQANSLMSNSETVTKESNELTNSAEELSTQIGVFKIGN